MNKIKTQNLLIVIEQIKGDERRTKNKVKHKVDRKQASVAEEYKWNNCSFYTVNVIDLSILVTVNMQPNGTEYTFVAAG